MPKRNDQKIRPWLQYLRGTKQRPHLATRRKTVSSTLMVAVPTALIFSIVNIALGHQWLGLFQLAVVAVVVFPTLMLVQQVRFTAISEQTLMLAAVLMFSSLVIDGGIAGTGIYWNFVFPFAAFYVMGVRLGWLWIGIYTLVLGLAFALIRSGQFPNVYSSEQWWVFATAMVFYSLLAFVFNILRERYEEELEHRVAKRTAEAVRSTQAMRESEAKYRTLLEKAPLAMFVFTDDVLTYANPSAVSMLKAVNAKALTGKHLNEFIPPRRTRTTRERLAELRKKGEDPSSLEEKICCLDGSEFEAEVSALPVVYDQKDALLMIVQDISERKAHLAKLQYLALFDDLTGLANRHLLHERLTIEMHSAGQADKSLVILAVDVNRFREINNIMGYANGDELLKQIAVRLQDAVGVDALVGRLGGDEFIVVLTGADQVQAKRMARHIQAEMEAPFSIEDTSIAIETSLGMSFYPQHGDSATVLIQHADVAMRLSKEEKDSFCVYDADRDPFSLKRLTMFRDLREAIHKNKLSLHYQPKVDLQSSRVTGVEALARWRTADSKDVPPFEFIPLAEQTGLIHPLGLWVMTEALSQCGKWKKSGLDLSIAINISAWDLIDENLPEIIAKLVGEWKLSAGQVTLEVTESAIMRHPKAATEVLSRLRDMGLQLAIDDFGTGHSSLAYLKNLPVSELKIDQSFVFGMQENKSDMAIVQSTIDLAHYLGLKVTAEGVENQETWNLLKQSSCDIVQGFYVSRALPAKEFKRWLEKSDWQS